jgi:uncharacterized protein (DUF2164 family)
MTAALLALILLALAGGAAIGAYYARHHGYEQGYRRAYAEQDLLVDDLRDEIDHLEQRNGELSKQMGAAA